MVPGESRKTLLDRVYGTMSFVDLSRRHGPRVAIAAVTLLFVLGGFDQLKTPALPMPANAATSVEEIAERLRGRLKGDVFESPLADLTFAPFATNLDTPLLHWCWPERERGIEARLPPGGVPAYTAQLRAPEVPEPLEVRFWITSPDQASRLISATRRGTGKCDYRDHNAISDVGDFDRGGWRGLRALVTTEYFTEEGDSGASATIVATRGALLAEVSWAWPFEAGGRPDPRPLHEGTAAAASVLAAVGGAPTAPAPAGAGSRAASAAMAAALPPPSAYGKDMKPWSDPVGLTHDLVCAAAFDENVHGGAPAVTRRLIGEVSVREDVLFLADERSAEEARVRPLIWRGSGTLPDKEEKPCDSEDPRSYSVGPHLAPFTRGPWTGEIETFAVRHPDLPPRLTRRDSVAHVAVAVRHGSTMVYLRWQGPAGTDPAAALRAGRAVLTRTLDRLPTGG